MAADLQIDIVTPKEKIYSGFADSVTLPGTKSPFQVLKNHAPIVSALDIGSIKVQTNGKIEDVFATSEGFAEISENKVSVIVETAVSAKEDNAELIEKEIESLQATLANLESDDHVKILNEIELLENRQKALERLQG
ncbi:MAG: hypothetical protein Kapaf2KO_03050 [Candidatus Kapaibacteriales bacterium]